MAETQQVPNCLESIFVGSRSVALSWPSHIKHRHFMLGDELHRQFGRSRRRYLSCIDQFVWLLLRDAVAHRLFGSTMQFAEIDDQGRVAVGDIFYRSLFITATGDFGQWIARSNSTILCRPARRTPAAAREAGSEGCIECTAVDTGLTAGDELGESHQASQLELPIGIRQQSVYQR